MTTAYLCIGLLGLLLFVLGFAVSLCRDHDNIIGTPTDPTHRLHKVIRAHGNTAEYAPMLALLIYIAALMNPATWVIWMMWIATASRYLIVIGLIAYPSLAKPNPFRMAGATGTYIAGTALAIAVLLGS
jgi:uncharacterized membrane protein YecN with MAPEG domain